MSFGGVIKLQGEKEYRRALQQIRQSLRETGSSLAAITSSFKTSSKSMDDSKASATKLNEVLKKQTSDHEKLKSAYEKMQVIYDKNNKSIDELTKRYKDAKAKLESLDETVDKTSEEYKGQVKVLQILEQSLENETQKQKANEIALSRMRVELNNSQTAMDKTAKELDQLEKSMSESEEAAKKANSAYGILKSTIEQQENELKSLKNEYKNVILEQGKESDSAKKLSSKIQDLSKNLKDNKTKLKDTEKAADDLETSMKDLAASTKKPIDGFKTFETALGNVIATVVQKAIDKLKELIKQTIDVGAKFDTAMSKVSAISGAKGDELLKLREKAKEMGASTKYTASEAAEAFNYMAMAGWTTEEMLEGISGVLNLAASSGTDLAETTDIVTDAMTAMGYSAGDAGHFADVLAAASANANTNVLKMGQTFQYAAPVLGALKYNIEDAALAIGLMADSGIKADKAGTALRSILTRLAAPPKDCANAMMELGISLTDAQGNMRPLKDVINDLRTSFSGLTEEEKASFAKAIAGKEAMSGLLSIVNTSKAKYDQLTGAISNCDGAADNMANTMLDNVEGGFTRLKSNFESTQIAIYEKFEPALRKATEFLNNLVGALQFVIDHSAEFEAALGGIAAGVATYLAVFKGASIIKGFATAIGTVTTAIDLLTIAISLNPLGAALVAVAALTTGFIILWNKSEKFRKFWIDLGENIKKVTKDIVDSISKWFVKAWEKVTEVWGKMSGWFSEKWESVKKVFGKVKDFFKEKFSGAWEAIKNIFSGWGKFFGNLWDTIKKKFSDLGTKIGDAIGGAVKSGINGVISMIEKTINKAIGLINGAIRLINLIPGLNIGELGEVKFPRLARGGVLDNGARTVIAGEDGTEAIVPLEKNTKWIKILANQLKDSFITSSSINNSNSLEDMKIQSEYNMMVDSFKQALSEMKIEMDEDIMGKFVERTVSSAVYS